MTNSASVRFCSFVLLVALLVGAGAFFKAMGQEQRTVPGFAFKGRLLVVVSDADMVASAYIDTLLGAPAGADTLSVIRLDRPPAEMRPATVGVTNSVIGPPASVAATPDSKYAIVIETQGPRPANKPEAKMVDLAPGRAVTVVDLSDSDRPRIVQQVEGFEHPLSVSVNAEGSLVAIAFGPPSKTNQPPVAIYRFRNGRLSAPMTPKVPGFAPGDALKSAEFHPKKNVLGLVYTTHPKLSFVQVATNGDEATLTRWGNSVDLDRSPLLVRFSPDGRYAIVNAFYIPDLRGTVSSIRLSAETKPDGSPHHSIVSHAETGVLPEGLAVSPDGRWVVTSNLERSNFPLTDLRQGFFSSLTLLRLDPDTGDLERIGDFPFDGVLPEAPLFDNSSRYVAVTSFDRFDGSKPGGSIDFWRISSDYVDSKRVELVKLNNSVPVARGAQSMVIVR